MDTLTELSKELFNPNEDASYLRGGIAQCTNGIFLIQCPVRVDNGTYATLEEATLR